MNHHYDISILPSQPNIILFVEITGLTQNLAPLFMCVTLSKSGPRYISAITPTM